MELEKDAHGDWQIVRKNYYYGDMLVMSTDGSDGDRWYYFHDKLGSVRAVVDGSGAVLNNYSYTPWGAEIESQTTETVRNNVRYAGYQYDNDLKQYYLWARMYSPYLARFNGYDPVRGDYKSPLTLNPYLYCLNDPVNFYDPTGRSLYCDQLSAMSTYANMASDVYDVASSVKDYASLVINGASFSNVMLSVAIDVGMEVAGGKVFEQLASVGSRAMKSIKKQRNGIYRSLDIDDNVQYVGRTNDFNRRKGEHWRERGIDIVEFEDLQDLSYEDARGVEQALIEHYGLDNLMNVRNGVSPNAENYDELLERGRWILEMIGFEE